MHIFDAMVGNRIWFGGLFTSSGRRRQINAEKTFELSPVQEQRLQKLKERLNIPYDQTRRDHQEALRALWSASFPDAELSSLISEQWKDMGWQGPNPSTDFRGCGFVGLENLLFFATTYPASYQRLLLKKQGMRATWEYPFAVAGVNVSYMLIQLLELNAERPKSLPGINFIKDVLEATKQQLERELSLEDVNGIRDIPAYNLLYK
uniref:ELMO domain-containing protein n=1 Tax=Oryza nivara TaxID=4536 RepID=A0A0E0GWY2_ORYNI